ncbi:hypothetical protein CLF_108658 [Clonorchis sinensis]|uniref:Uncharacterized protein n=1 Tax=Clonorchis sinensis TaxID=79923 RepID=G7YIC9_CLOSI|nr:hypothetical protein CLF_108658 [Clonorchis sinensis]
MDVFNAAAIAVAVAMRYTDCQRQDRNILVWEIYKALDINRIRNIRTNHMVMAWLNGQSDLIKTLLNVFAQKNPRTTDWYRLHNEISNKNLEILVGFETLTLTLRCQTGYRLTEMNHVRRRIRCVEQATCSSLEVTQVSFGHKFESYNRIPIDPVIDNSLDRPNRDRFKGTQYTTSKTCSLSVT